MKNLVIGIGEALWDVLPDGKKIGGAPANFAFHVSQFGLDGLAISAVGEDELGAELIKNLDKNGVNYNLAVVPYPTGTVCVQLDKAGIPQYEIKQNVAWDNIPDTPELRKLAKDAKAICFGSLAQRNIISRNTINAFLKSIPAENDPLIVFDINLRQKWYSPEILHESMKNCNILKINDEELITVSQLFDFQESDFKTLCRRLLDKYNLKILILTCGINGSYVFTHEDFSYLPTPQVKVADTVGAGDSFTAAFIASILKGASVVEAHKKAVETSAFVCSQKGAMPIFPDAITGN